MLRNTKEPECAFQKRDDLGFWDKDEKEGEEN